MTQIDHQRLDRWGAGTWMPGCVPIWFSAS